jgi:dihydroorotase
MNEGAVSTKLGLKGIPNASESVIVARDLILAELTGGHYHLLHASTAEAVQLVREAKARGVNVTCEAAPHHFTLTDELVEQHRAYAKMNPPLRAEQDRAAIIEGLKDGTIDAIATDHAPHEPEAKRVPMDEAAFGIVGLETMLPVSLHALYHSGEMPLRDVIAAMTYKPADIIGVDSGRIKKGAQADLVLIDLNKEWNIQPEAFESKSKNSPYIGTPTKGKALRTIVAGSTVFIDE